MPRRRNTDPTSLITPILARFAAEMASTVERFTSERIEQAVKRAFLTGAPVRTPSFRRGRKRPTVHCYYPGCKNVAAPRFGMFCAAEHKGISKREKAQHREKRETTVMAN